MLIDFFLIFISFGSALTVLTILSKIDFMENLFFRVITGGTVGTLTSSYLTGVTPTLSFYETALNGDFGIGGYAAVITTGILIGVWIYNIFTYRGQVIQ